MEKKEYKIINGTEHFIISYEWNPDSPVILYVHGGPGLSETLIGWEISAHTEELCNWVFYDQRGAGRTFYKSPESLVTYEEIFEDLKEIVQIVYERYNKKIFLMGHNWGTVPAIRMAREYPQYVAGYIGYCQMVDMVNVNKIRCNRIRELAAVSGSRHDMKLIDKIEAATEGTFSKDMLKKKMVTKLNVLLNKYNVSSGTDKLLMRKIPTSPIYDLSDLKIMMNGPKISYKLNEYVKTVNLFEEPMDYSVPMMFITGNWDYQTPYITAKEYMDKITAPVKKLTVLEDVTYNAMFESPGEFWDEVVRFIKENK